MIHCNVIFSICLTLAHRHLSAELSLLHLDPSRTLKTKKVGLGFLLKTHPTNDDSLKSQLVIPYVNTFLSESPFWIELNQPFEIPNIA